jgi:hypothetical protein
VFQDLLGTPDFLLLGKLGSTEKIIIFAKILRVRAIMRERACE